MKMKEFSNQREKARYYRSLSGERKTEAFCEMLEESEMTVFLGGAGVSTESGIPDFRSKNGLYRKSGRLFSRYKPEYLLSSKCLFDRPELFFSYYRKNLDCRNAEPNDAHKVLAALEQEGKLEGLVTQNIDGLHQKAGSRKVQEIHGSILRSYCTYCRKQYGPDYLFENKDPVPLCPDCGRMIRPDVTLYGEFLPQPAYDNAVDLMNRADMLVIGGTSLAVGSAAQLAHLFHGRYLVIVNKGPTKLEGKADLVFHESIGDIFREVYDRIGGGNPD